MANGYTNIPDWMLELDLDVYETIIYAIVFGFSQDGESTFSGSQKYLAEKAKCSKRKVANALNRLVDLELIKKIDKDVRGIHLCEYYCTACKGIAPRATGDARRATNNIEDININNTLSIKRDTFQKPTIDEIRDYCNERHNNINPVAFFSFYESNGWMIGKTKMKNWKSAIVTWEQRDNNKPARPATKRESALEHNLRVADEMFGTDIHSRFYKTPEYDEQ